MTTDPPSLRQRAHDVGLLFCAAIGVYLISMVVARLVGVRLALAVRTWESAAARVALGVVALDLTRLPALLAVAWVLGSGIRLRPLTAAVLLVVLTYTFDVMMVFILGQVGPLFGSLPVLLLRAAAASLLVWLSCLVFRRRQR